MEYNNGWECVYRGIYLLEYIRRVASVRMYPMGYAYLERIEPGICGKVL